MSKSTKYIWQEVTKEKEFGTIKFSQGSVYIGNPSFDEIKASRFPDGGLNISKENWEALQRGEKVFVTKTYTKEFEIMKEE